MKKQFPAISFADANIISRCWRVSGLEATLIPDSAAILIEFECDAGGPLDGARFGLTPPAAAELSRQLRRAVKDYINPPDDAADEQAS